MQAQIKKPNEDGINFCLTKCGSGYCPAMSGRGGFPCLEYICAFCTKIVGMEDPMKTNYCKFCKGEI